MPNKLIGHFTTSKKTVGVANELAYVIIEKTLC